MIRARGAAALAVLISAGALWQPAAAGTTPAATSVVQAAGRAETIWDGIYTTGQASRGADLYKSECSYCHRDDLTGGFFDNGTGRAPALAGPGAFGSSLVERWKGLSVGDMLAAIASEMPQQKPASLSLQAYVDIVSYLFSKNEIPAGSEELSTDIDTLGTLLIVSKPR